MGMWPRVIRGIQNGVELLLLHQIDEQLPERFARDVELFRGRIQCRARRPGRQRSLESSRADGRKLS